MTQLMDVLQPYLRPGAARKALDASSTPQSPETFEPAPAAAGDAKGHYWFAICTIALIIASDYKIRTRDPSQTFHASVDSLILIELALYGCVGLYLLLAHARRPRIRRTKPIIYLACFYVGLMAFSVAYTAYPEYALVRVGEMGVLLALILVAARSATRADLHRLAHFYIALISVSVVYGVLIPSPPVTKLQAGRFTWLAIHPTITGVLLGIATVLTVGYLVAGHRPRPGVVWPRAGYWVALVLVGGGLIASQTRGAVVAAFVAVIVVLFVLRGRRTMMQLQALLIIAALVIALTAGGSVVKYFERGESTQQLSSLNSRTSFWGEAADAIARKPMFGYGVTSARGIFFDTSGLGGGHNAVINVLVELGLVGFVTWGALVLLLISGIRRLPTRRLRELLVDKALLLGVITFLLVDGIFYEGAGAVSNVACTWLFVCIAWVAVAGRYSKDMASTASASH
jgi:exopolysaccharide production protein ExoQ